jgi:hypothetical protein
MIFLHVTFIGYNLAVSPAANPVWHSSYQLLGSVEIWLTAPSLNLSRNYFSILTEFFLKIPESSNTYYALNVKYYCMVSK